MPRVKLIQQRDDVAPEHHALFDELAARRQRISGPSSVVMHSPGLAKPWNDVSEYLHGQSPVEARYAELAVSVTARENDCAYIWAAHAGRARNAGTSEATLSAAETRGPLDGLPRDEADIVRFARGIVRDNRVDASLFAGLLSAHGERWMMDLCCWVGRYSALSCILNAFEVAPAPDAPQLASMPEWRSDKPSPAAPGPTPRITPIRERSQVSDADATVFDAVAEGRGNVRGPWTLLMHSPELCRSILDVSTYLRFGGDVSPRMRELVTIATAREKDCPYVWAAHAPAARAAGVEDTAVSLIRQRGALTDLPSADADAIDYVRQLLRTHRVEQSLFDRLQAEHGTKRLVEMTCVIGHYVFVTALLNACEFAPAPDAEKLD